MSVHSNDTANTNQIIQKEETTNFIDAGDAHELKMNHITGTDVPLTGLDIPSFMKKPYLFASGTLTPASVVNSVLMTSSVGATLLGNPQWINKMYGFNLVRGDACVKIVVNANPFQAGRLLLHFQPSNVSATRSAMHNATIATKTTQPGVELDLRQSSVTMKVPYVGPKNYYSLSNGAGFTSMDWGTFYLTVIDPLSTGAAGDLSVSWTAYMWFENFELAAPIVPQSRSAKPRSRSLLSVEQEAKDGSRSTSLASISKSISTASGSLSSIPGLGSVMGPLSWASGVAAGVFDYLGWSKPINLDKPMLVNGFRYLANSDGIDCSVPLTIRSDNKVNIIDCCSGRSEDEMSFAFLKQVPSLVSRFTFSETDIADSILYTTTIRPSNLREVSTKTVAGKVATYESGAPFYCMSKVFSMWRGSIVMRLSFVKTDYHSGRLQITFTPSSSLLPTNPTLATGTLAMRTIVDIREFSDVSIELPYLMDVSYLASNVSMGTLQIRVLNPLKAPETAASTITGLIYYHAGEDFEFQAPGSGVGSVAPCVFSPQADMDYTLLKTSAGGLRGKPLDTAFSSMSVGEHFTSIKQLLNRMTPIESNISVGSATSGGEINYWPWHTAIVSMNAATGALALPGTSCDSYSFFSQWFAYYRGAMVVSHNVTNASSGYGDYSIEDNDNVTVPLYATTRGLRPWGTAWNPTTCSSRFTGYHPFYSNMSLNGYALFRVPYYCKTHCSLVPTNLTSYADSVLPESNPVAVLTMTNSSVSAVGIIQIFRAAADDFQLSYFIGTVPILTDYV